MRREGRETKMKMIDKMRSRGKEKKRWIWKMQQDIFRENGNGFKKQENFWLRRERREKKGKRRRSDINLI